MDQLAGLGAVRRASDLLPALTMRAAETDRLRQVPAESVADLRASGLLRIGNPKRFGGTDLDIDTALDVAQELGRGCGSTAWCYSIWSAHNWWIGHFPEQCQEEYFADGPDTLFSSGLSVANSTAEPVPGGYRMSGRWGFSSGCDAASWVMVASRRGEGDKVWMLVPRSDVEIIDTWHPAGLRGTGSKDVRAREVFVPEHRAIDPNRAGVDDHTGWRLHHRASYGVPLKVMTDWALAAPLIGMAQGVLDEVVGRARSERGPGGRAVAVGLRVAEAAAEIDAASTMRRAAVREILDHSGDPDWFTPLVRARYRRDASYVTRLCVRTANLLYEATGARAVMDAEPIQRRHRDVHTGSHHAALNWDAAALEFSDRVLA